MSATPPTILIAGAGVVGLARRGTARDRALCGPAARARARGAPAAASGAPTRPICASTRCRVRRSACSIRSARGNVSLARRASAYRRMHVWEGEDPSRRRARVRQRRDRGAGPRPYRRRQFAAQGLGRGARGRSERRARARRRLESVDVDSRLARVRLADGRSAQGTCSSPRTAASLRSAACSSCRSTARSYGQTGLVTHVATERPHRETAWQRFLPGGPLAFLPLADGRSSVVWSLPSERARRADRRGTRLVPRGATARERRRSRRARRLQPARGIPVAGAACAAATARRGPCWWATRRIRFTRSPAKG